MSVKTENPLSPRQELFVNFYLGEAKFNATKAARLAGYQGNDNVLGVTGFDLLRLPKIQTLIKQRLDTFAMPAAEVLQRLSKHARASLLDVLTEEGEFSIKDAKRRGVDDLVKRLKVKKHLIPQSGKDEEGNPKPPIVEYDYEYEIHDPQAALVQLGRHHKLFTDKVEQTNIPSPVEEARKYLALVKARMPELTEFDIYELSIKPKPEYAGVTAEMLGIEEVRENEEDRTRP